MTTIDVKDKVAIVTGASRGIGESIARALASNGAHVVLASRRIEGVRTVAASIGPSAVAVAAHTGREDECANLVKMAVERFGRVDVLVNNAGTNPYNGPLLDAPMPAWDKTFEVNVKGYFWMTRDVARHLVARDAPGSIINIASTSAFIAAPPQGVYSMTKASVISMTKTFAYELAARRIRVNAIAPGFVDTKFSAAVLKDEALLAEVLAMTPMKRCAAPDEMAGAALFLASDASSYMTGQAIVVDGGMTIA